MTFSWMGGSQESDSAYKAQMADALENLKKQRSQSASRAPVEDQQRAENQKIADTNIALANKKALDFATKKASDYAAGIVDPAEALAKSRKEKADSEAALSDYEQYDRKQALDLKNQDTAWASASKFRQSDAEQSNIAQKDRLVAGLDNQKEMQRNTINQANKLRSDDNQRAIDGFKMNF